MSDWNQWKRANAGKVKVYEVDFVDLVLCQIPEISPADVVHQFRFQDAGDISRYIDFMIINPSKGYLLPIELDGKDKKPNESHKDWNDFLARQNVLLKKFRVLLRFSNNQMKYYTISTIDAIQKELWIQAADKARDDRLRQALADFVTPTEPAPSSALVTTQLPRSSLSAWRQVAIACTMLFATAVLGVFVFPSIPRQNSADREAVGATTSIGLTRTPETFTSIASANAAPVEEQIEALRAPFHVGESVLACGKVAQVTARSEIAYVNLDRPYPNHTLALVIWQRELPAYEARLGKLSTLEGKRVCARGTIEEYRKGLQLILKNPQFLRLMHS